MSTKGQVLSADFLIASGIFILTIIILYSHWSYTNVQLEETRKLNEITDAAYTISNVWFREGTPEYWSASNVIDLGLQNNHRFNQSKLNALNNIGYAKVKKMIGIPLYDFYLRIHDTENNTFFDFGIFPSDSESIEIVKRIGIMNNTIVFVETMVWE
jgi:hypothetical protein